ncbi:TraR/DksA family transcriptional regulator [Alishewanella sp. d11]|uniref:TraR/DksA family transcriptional regulator n=1 Tax=Alishewanella sp. d11 TaxID=3414030 RepID=UPI003BF81EB9
MPLQELKRRLISRKLELEHQVTAIARDFAQGRSANLTEQAQQRENDDVLTALDEKDRLELRQIDRALSRIEHGTYDKCANCGAVISAERLNIVPFTESCIRCAN